MSNTRIMLQATGEHDRYLTTDPKHTLFKKNHKTHTIFGTDWNIINVNPKDNIQPATQYGFRIDKNGDLMMEIYLRFKVKSNPDFDAGLEGIFHLFDKIELYCNNQKLTSMTSDFIFSYFELHYTYAEKKQLINMMSYDKVHKTTSEPSGDVYLTIPLPFWFHKSPENAFPMWAMHNPNINIEINTSNYSNNIEIKDIEILVHFAQIDSIEKNKLSENKSLEYIVDIPERLETFDIDDGSAIKKQLMLSKHHYIRYMFWNIQRNDDDATKSKSKFTYLDDLNNASIVFNGNTLMNNGSGTFYNLVNRHMHFNSGGTTLCLSDTSNNPINPVYSYSFCLQPSSKKISGFFTSEKFNDVVFDLDIKEASATGVTKRKVNIYMVRHNIFRIQDGYLNILFN